MRGLFKGNSRFDELAMLQRHKPALKKRFDRIRIGEEPEQ
jgi:hypothetical protein